VFIKLYISLLIIVDMDTIINAIQSRMDNLLYDNPCPFTQAAFVDVQTSFFYAAIQKQRYLFGRIVHKSRLKISTHKFQFPEYSGPRSKT
jgi:hypothetical protein